MWGSACVYQHNIPRNIHLYNVWLFSKKKRLNNTIMFAQMPGIRTTEALYKALYRADILQYWKNSSNFRKFKEDEISVSRRKRGVRVSLHATSHHFWKKAPDQLRPRIRTRIQICCQNFHPRKSIFLEFPQSFPEFPQSSVNGGGVTELWTRNSEIQWTGKGMINNNNNSIAAVMEYQ